MTPDEYQVAVRDLAGRAAMPDDAAARVEADLERAFDAVAAAAGSKKPVPRGRYRGLAAAAALAAAVGGIVWYARQQPVTPDSVMVKEAPPAAAGGTRVKVDGGNGVRLKADTTDGVHPGVVATTSRRKHAKHLPRVIQPAGFVAVPAAARLPQFESGVIVRLSLPVAVLPSYGVDISPASSGDAVEADVLVAQDGVARAIRLVNTSRSQQ